MSERDLATEIDALAKRIEAIEAEAKRLNAVILDDVLHTLGDMKEVAAIERAATCKGCGKPLLPENAWMEDGCPCNSPKGCNSPAQADVGEAPASSQPPFVGQVVEAINNECVAIRKGERLTVAAITEDGHLHFDDKPSLNYPAWCFRPIPATVEQGPTAGMKKAANMLGYHDDHHQYPQISCVLEVLQKHIGPELAAKDAEILSAIGIYQDTCKLLQEARAEIERLKADRQDAAEAERKLADRMPKWDAAPLDDGTLAYIASEIDHDLRNEQKPCEGEMRVRWNNRSAGMLLKTIEHYRQQLSAATAANVERDRDHEVMEWWRKHPRPIATFGHKWYCEPIGDDLRHLCDDPATAILAAKTAGGE